ncbi:unnamed protein product, partial [Mycena citricolor]
STTSLSSNRDDYGHSPPYILYICHRRGAHDLRCSLHAEGSPTSGSPNCDHVNIGLLLPLVDGDILGPTPSSHSTSTLPESGRVSRLVQELSQIPFTLRTISQHVVSNSNAFSLLRSRIVDVDDQHLPSA